MKKIMMVLGLISLLVLSGCAKYDYDCIENKSKDYCNSINESFKDISFWMGGVDSFTCIKENRIEITHIFTDKEKEECSK